MWQSIFTFNIIHFHVSLKLPGFSQLISWKFISKNNFVLICKCFGEQAPDPTPSLAPQLLSSGDKIDLIRQEPILQSLSEAPSQTSKNEEPVQQITGLGDIHFFFFVTSAGRY